MVVTWILNSQQSSFGLSLIQFWNSEATCPLRGYQASSDISTPDLLGIFRQRRARFVSVVLDFSNLCHLTGKLKRADRFWSDLEQYWFPAPFSHFLVISGMPYVCEREIPKSPPRRAQKKQSAPIEGAHRQLVRNPHWYRSLDSHTHPYIQSSLSWEWTWETFSSKQILRT